MSLFAPGVQRSLVCKCQAVGLAACNLGNSLVPLYKVVKHHGYVFLRSIPNLSASLTAESAAPTKYLAVFA